MDKSQAEAIVEAILEPNVHAQEEVQKNRAAAAKLHAAKRRVAWFSLAGFGLGAVVAHFISVPLVAGALWGGLAGSAAGWLASRVP
jgi:hypothetical protein